MPGMNGGWSGRATRYRKDLRMEDDEGFQDETARGMGGSPVRERRGLMLFWGFALDDAFLPGVNSYLGSVSKVQLAEDVANVAFDGVLADDQFLSDLVVAQSIGDELKHF